MFSWLIEQHVNKCSRIIRGIWSSLKNEVNGSFVVNILSEVSERELG